MVEEGAGPFWTSDICSEERNSFLWELTPVLRSQWVSWLTRFPWVCTHQLYHYDTLTYMLSKLAKIRVWKKIYQWLAKYTSSYMKHSRTGQPPKRKYDTRWTHPRSTVYVVSFFNGWPIRLYEIVVCVAHLHFPPLLQMQTAFMTALFSYFERHGSS